MHLSNEDVAAIFLREVSQAQGYESDVLGEKRAAALDAYYGLTPEAVEGRSGVISTDVRDGVHAVLAQIMPVLQSTMIEFVPTGQDDEQQSQAETDFVRNAIERAGAFRAVAESVHDALLIANGWLRVDAPEESIDTVTDYPPGLDDNQIYVIRQAHAAQQNVSKVTISESKTKTRVRTTTVTRRLRIESVPPENMLFSENGGQFRLGELRFVAERKLYTVSELTNIGISRELIDDLPDAVSHDWADSSARQGIYQNETGGFQPAKSGSESLKRIYCGYLRISLSDGATSELRRVWVGDNSNTTLINEPAEFIPYISGSAVPVPHRIQGTGLYELLWPVQAAKTSVLRNYLDNLQLMNGSRIAAVEGQVNLNDLTNGRINGVVRVRTPNAVIPLPSTDIGPQAMAGLSYLDSIMSARIGATVDFNEVQAQLMGTSATAASGMLAKVEQMAGWFAGNLAATMLLPLHQLVHAVLRTQIAGPVSAKMAGKWQQTDTSQWRERDATDLAMGMTTVERASRQMALREVITAQQQMLASGGAGVITDQSRLYASMSDWIRSSDLGDPTQYLIDPSTPEAQQSAQQQQQQQQQQKEEIEQQQQALIAMQHKLEMDKQAAELAWKYYNTDVNAQIDEAKITADSVTKMHQINAAEKDTEEEMDD